MNCPTCDQTELLCRERFGIMLHHCPRCRGVWLERGAIDRLQERTGLFLKARAAGNLPPGRPGLRQPLWKELFDDE